MTTPKLPETMPVDINLYEDYKDFSFQNLIIDSSLLSKSDFKIISNSTEFKEILESKKLEDLFEKAKNFTPNVYYSSGKIDSMNFLIFPGPKEGQLKLALKPVMSNYFLEYITTKFNHSFKLIFGFKDLFRALVKYNTKKNITSLGILKNFQINPRSYFGIKAATSFGQIDSTIYMNNFIKEIYYIHDFFDIPELLEFDYESYSQMQFKLSLANINREAKIDTRNASINTLKRNYLPLSTYNLKSSINYRKEMSLLKCSAELTNLMNKNRFFKLHGSMRKIINLYSAYDCQLNLRCGTIYGNEDFLAQSDGLYMKSNRGCLYAGDKNVKKEYIQNPYVGDRQPLKSLGEASIKILCKEVFPFNYLDNFGINAYPYATAYVSYGDNKKIHESSPNFIDRCRSFAGFGISLRSHFLSCEAFYNFWALKRKSDIFNEFGIEFSID